MAALNQKKYQNALLYFISECGNEKLGIMKLNKLFYYLDFISYRDRQMSVTGERYLPFPKGPFAASLEKELERAQKEKLINRQKDKSEKYGERNRFYAVKPYNLSVFDAYEKDLLQYLCGQFKEWNTDQMVAQTHTEAPWVFSTKGKPLDYKQADDIEFFSARKLTAA